MDKHRLSLIVIGIFAVAILAGGWFLGVQPQLDRIDRAATQTASISQINDVQEAKNEALALENERLEEYKLDLAAKQETIPASRSQQELINQLDAAAVAAGVTVRNLSFDGAAAFLAPEAVTTGAPVGSTLIAVPLTLAIDGDRAALKSFVANVQSSKRIITIDSTQYSGGDSGSLSISGTTWVLLPG